MGDKEQGFYYSDRFAGEWHKAQLKARKTPDDVFADFSDATVHDYTQARYFDTTEAVRYEVIQEAGINREYILFGILGKVGVATLRAGMNYLKHEGDLVLIPYPHFNEQGNVYEKAIIKLADSTFQKVVDSLP